MSTTATIGLGSNTGDPLARLAEAVTRLGALPGCRLSAASRVYETEPVGPEQPAYLNQVVSLETSATPAELLPTLLALERDLGRDRTTESVRWGPRLIDIDLLLSGAAVVDGPGLTVPHPHLTARSFVLVPLTEVAPQACHPLTGRRLADHAADLRGTSDWTWVRPYHPGRRGLPRTRAEDDIRAIPSLSRAWRAEGLTVGLVPTMGALHQGHLSLMRQARACCDVVVVTVFVNPLQFGAGEDLSSYPRDLTRDVALCQSVGVDLVVTTTPEAMYPTGYSTFVTEEALGQTLCGAARPGHFRGVTTVVTKLFHLVWPDVAFFGRKDAQQAAILARMTADLNFPIRIETLPIVREPDGLALSSRNAHLSPEERTRALGLVAGLRAAGAAFEGGETSPAAITRAVREGVAADGEVVRVDYALLVGASDMQPVAEAAAGDLLAIAVFVGETRLIDNMVLGESL